MRITPLFSNNSYLYKEVSIKNLSYYHLRFFMILKNYWLFNCENLNYSINNLRMKM